MKIKIAIDVSAGSSPMDVWRRLYDIQAVKNLVLTDKVHLVFGDYEILLPKGAALETIMQMVVVIPLEVPTLSMTDVDLRFEVINNEVINNEEN